MWGTYLYLTFVQRDGGEAVGRCRGMPAALGWNGVIRTPNWTEYKGIYPYLELGRSHFKFVKPAAANRYTVLAPPGPWVISVAVSYTVPPKSTK
jgi:hypothetical protein